MSSPTSVAVVPRPADVERWLDELAIERLERADREGVVAWDVVLDGRRRRGLRVTLILDPTLGLICWAHYAPPITDLFRKSYRKLLRWNDELPFVKFAIGEDERPILTAELAPDALGRDAVGLALARLVAVSDRLLDESAEWLWPGGKPPADGTAAADRTPAADATPADATPAAEGGRPSQEAPSDGATARPTPLLDRYAHRLEELTG